MSKILSFLAELKVNNHREWFEANRMKYEAAKEELITHVSGLISEIKRWDDSVGDRPAKDYIFRINRDVRFSKDKSPYKTNMGAFIGKGGRKTNLAGYYLHFEPGASMIAGGIYMPMPYDLKKIRQEIDYNAQEFEAIMQEREMKKRFGELDRGMALKGAPKGYEADNPMLPYLQLKSFTVSRMLSDKEVQAKGFIPETAKACGAMHPLLVFLNRAVEG